MDVIDALRAYTTPPPWLVAASDGRQVADVLRREVSEFSDGPIRLRDCRVDDLRLKDDRWVGRYVLTVEGEGGELCPIAVTGALRADGGLSEPPTGRGALGSDDWHVSLAAPPLILQATRADDKLRALPLLANPVTAQALLETSLDACYPGIRIASCDTTMTRYRPGQRCTVICNLTYSPDANRSSWPDVVVAKVHRRGEGERGYGALQALARAEVGRSGSLAVALPLANLPDQDVSVQSYVPQDRSLVELVARAAAGTDTAVAEADDAVRCVADALVALHHAPVRYGLVRTIDDEVAAVRARASRLEAVFGQLRGAVEPLMRFIERVAADVGPDRARPAHGAFRPAQIRLCDGRVGVVDLDAFGECEPGQDVGRFVGKLRLVAMRESAGRDPAVPGGLSVADRLATSFVERYSTNASVSPTRIALWETLDLTTTLLQSWYRGRPGQIPLVLTLLQLRAAALEHR